jgi:Mn2+/Fe2+ NRAMP family transporter
MSDALRQTLLTAAALLAFTTVCFTIATLIHARANARDNGGHHGGHIFAIFLLLVGTLLVIIDVVTTSAALDILPTQLPFMTGDQQFYILLGILVVNVVFIFLVYFKLDEFKQMLTTDSDKKSTAARKAGVREGHDEADAEIAAMNRPNAKRDGPKKR